MILSNNNQNQKNRRWMRAFLVRVLSSNIKTRSVGDRKQYRITSKKPLLSIILELLGKFIESLDVNIDKDNMMCIAMVKFKYPYLLQQFTHQIRQNINKIQQKNLELYKVICQKIQQERVDNELETIVEEYFKYIQADVYQKNQIKQDLIKKLFIYNDQNKLAQQFTINWIKMNLEKKTSISNRQLCCKIFYVHEDYMDATQSEIQQFKRYHWPITNANLIFHLQKTVVGFLNNRGGMIYMGIFEEKIKSVKVQGIQLKPQNKVEMINFIKQEILSEVKPIQKQTQAQKTYSDIYGIGKTMTREEYHFNPYVSADFRPIAHKYTLLNKPNLYVARIKVRPGNFQTLYYLNSVKVPITPQYYIREDKSVKKKPLPEAKEQIYRRLGLSHPLKQLYQSYHDHCRFDLYPFQFNLPIALKDLHQPTSQSNIQMVRE